MLQLSEIYLFKRRKLKREREREKGRNEMKLYGTFE